MIRQLIWFLMGWPGPIPLHEHRSVEYLIALGGAILILACYPLFFRLCFLISQSGKTARVGSWVSAMSLGLAWYLLVLDLFLFNTTLIVFSASFFILGGITLYLFINRI